MTEPQLNKLRERYDKLAHFDKPWLPLVQELCGSLRRIAGDEDPTYRYGLLVEGVRTALCAAAAAGVAQLSAEHAALTQLEADYAALGAAAEAPPKLPDLCVAMEALIAELEQARRQLADYMDGLAAYVRAPRYGPDQPLGKELMQSAAEHFAQQAAPPTPSDQTAVGLQQMAAQLIGEQKPTADQAALHKQLLLDMLQQEVEHAYAAAQRAQSQHVCGNPYWFGAK